MKKVTIKIKSGKISADFTGFEGRECEYLDQRIRPGELEEEDKELKPEYYNETYSGQLESNEWS